MKTKIHLLTLAVIFVAKFTSAQTIINSYSGSQSSTNINISWQSSSEINMDFYTVERSLDSINYNIVQNVNAGGNSNTQNNYSYSDTGTFADTCYYYRLKATQFNGQSQYIDTIQVCYNSLVASAIELNSILNINIYPNPVKNGLLNIELPENENYNLNIFNQLGQEVSAINIVTKKISIDCSKFNSGVYYVQIINNNGQSNTVKFIVE